MPKAKTTSKTKSKTKSRASAKSKSSIGLLSKGKFKFNKTLVLVVIAVVVATGGYLFYRASHAASAAYTLFGTTTPASKYTTNDKPIELGVKFAANSNGAISGIRFYKGTGNTGVHTGSLWTSTGQRLATATFTSETASGWQQVKFASPVAIKAGTTYVASYHAPNGHGIFSLGYFTNKSHVSGPLTALASNGSIHNGVDLYGPSSYPSAPSLGNLNFWVDVIYSLPPAAPGGVSATASGNNITVRWSPSSDYLPITSYGVFRNGTKIASTASLSYTDLGLSNGTYAYTISATDTVGNISAVSAVAKATTGVGGDPCKAENPTTTGYPCTANTGAHGISFGSANTTAHNSSSCTNCPAGMTWSSGGGYQINSCVTIDGWKITGDVDVLASNGKKGVYGTEASAISNACVKITHSLIIPPEPGRDAEVALSTGFSNYNLQCRVGGSPATCGPVYFADSEISMAQPRTGFNYATSNTNLHLWRAYLHGGPQGIDSDGYSEVHDSYLRADRSEAAMSGAAHGDAYFQRGGSAPWMLVDHNTLFCGAQEIDCNRDGAYVNDEAAPDGGIIKNNLFKASNGVYYCFSSGVDQTRANKPFPYGKNLVIKDNMFETGTGGNPCQHGNSVDDYTPSLAASHNDKWCNNKMDDGTLVNAAFETGGCP